MSDLLRQFEYDEYDDEFYSDEEENILSTSMEHYFKHSSDSHSISLEIVTKNQKFVTKKKNHKSKSAKTRKKVAKERKQLDFPPKVREQAQQCRDLQFLEADMCDSERVHFNLVDNGKS